jgi:hypothetical protein
MRRPSRILAAVATAVTATAVALGGCSADSGGGSAQDTPSASASTSPTPSSTVGVPDGVSLTNQGSGLAFGDPAQVIFESTQNKGTVLELTVRSVREGRLRDFSGFILDDSYKQKASYYYARVTVKNVGRGDVGGVAVPLWGVNKADTLLPPVNFTTEFQPCPSRKLPARFPQGATLSTCLVYLSPDKGALEAVSYRPSQQYDPITWSGTILEPAPLPKPTKKPTDKPTKKPTKKPKT